jgi:hypothetical protein
MTSRNPEHRPGTDEVGHEQRSPLRARRGDPGHRPLPGLRPRDRHDPRSVHEIAEDLRTAIRRRIIETDGPDLVRAGTATMADYDLEELRDVFRSVMRKGTRYEREEVIPAMAHYLGFVRVTDTIREPIKSAITSAIRRGILGYEGSVIWRED